MPPGCVRRRHRDNTDLLGCPLSPRVRNSAIINRIELQITIWNYAPSESVRIRPPAKYELMVREYNNVTQTKKLTNTFYHFHVSYFFPTQVGNSKCSGKDVSENFAAAAKRYAVYSKRNRFITKTERFEKLYRIWW